MRSVQNTKQMAEVHFKVREIQTCHSAQTVLYSVAALFLDVWWRNVYTAFVSSVVLIKNHNHLGVFLPLVTACPHRMRPVLLTCNFMFE